jgi:hypothetical protein
MVDEFSGFSSTHFLCLATWQTSGHQCGTCGTISDKTLVVV